MMIGPAFDHVGLSVADLDAQCRFYTEALGFQQEHYAEFHDARIRIALLRAPSGAALELTERAGSTPQRFTDAFDGASVQGYFHWAMTVADLDTAIAAAAAVGARTVTAPAAATRPGMRFAYLADPEGNLIELLQPAS